MKKIPAMIRPLSLLALTLLSAPSACGGDTLEPAELASLPSTEGYEQWKHYETQGYSPGHRESFRRVFVNSLVEGAAPRVRFPTGSVVVKEIYELAGTSERPAPGTLRYRAIMRRLAQPPTGLILDDDWLFTSRSGDVERRVSTCWSSCHAQAANDGLFLDPRAFP